MTGNQRQDDDQVRGHKEGTSGPGGVCKVHQVPLHEAARGPQPEVRHRETGRRVLRAYRPSHLERQRETVHANSRYHGMIRKTKVNDFLSGLGC